MSDSHWLKSIFEQDFGAFVEQKARAFQAAKNRHAKGCQFHPVSRSLKSKVATFVSRLTSGAKSHLLRLQRLGKMLSVVTPRSGDGISPEYSYSGDFEISSLLSSLRKPLSSLDMVLGELKG